MEKTKLLILRLTDRCNLRCKYCYAAMDNRDNHDFVQDMSFETARKAIDFFAKPGDKLKIQFTGGEPLLMTELMEAISQYVKEKNIQTLFSLQTNGTLLTEQNCRLLKTMNCAIGISLDGMKDANNLRVYPNGQKSFEDVIKGICMLRKYTLYCNFNSVVTKQNQERLEELIDLAAYLGNVRGVGLDMFRPLGRGKEFELVPRMESLGEDLEKMLRRRDELQKMGVNIRIKELEKVKCMLEGASQETCYCYAQTGLSAAVDPRGDFYPCSSFVGMKEMCMGNVETGFHFLDTVPGLNGACKECKDLMFCKGGCPAGRVAYDGYNEADCLMHRTIIKYGREQSNGSR